MKRIILILLTVVLVSCNNKEKDVKPDYVIFNGKVENSPTKQVKLVGSDFEKTLTMSENGTFSDTLKINKDGLYTMFIGRESSPLYLTKGANVNVTLNAKEFDESIVYTGDIAPENNYLAKKYLVLENGFNIKKVYSLAENEFLDEINMLNDTYKNLLNEAKGISKEFKELETKELKYAHLNNIENYKEYHSYFKNNDSFKPSDSFYDVVNDFNFSDTDAYNNSNAYKSLLVTHFNRVAKQNSEKSGKGEAVSFLELVNSKIPNGKIKEELMLNYLQYGMKADKDLEKVYSIFKESNPSSENLSKVTARYNLLKNIVPGKKSPTFNYENYKGGKTNLEDLKGKLVYVDVWATWCGPCKKEIPHLKKLEEEYQNQNIAFVSISVDKKKDYETWRNMIKEKELGGIQLFADKNWGSKFVTEYGIRGIPRFLLIDAEGKIINSDAPRPSSSNIRSTLNSLL